MKRLIVNGNIVLDGTKPKYKKEQEAFEKLEIIEELLERYEIQNLVELKLVLLTYCQTLKIKENSEIWVGLDTMMKSMQ